MSGEADNLLPGSVPKHPTKQDGNPILVAPVAPPPYQENQQGKL